jgi:hypothetical protein
LKQIANHIHTPPPKTLTKWRAFLLKRIPQRFVSKSRIWFEITLIFVELFLFSSLPMGRGKSGRDLQFLFRFFQQNCFHMSGNCKYFAIFRFMGLACLASFALIYL